MGGGSKSTTVGYKYYLGMHMINVHGETDATLRIRVDDKDAWNGWIKDGLIYINNPDLFGGESREGGIAGYVDIISGSQSQGQNDYLVSQLGANVPAFRGVAALVLRKVYLGINPYLKRWSSLIQRINRKSDGSTQWYAAKASIPNGSMVGGTGTPVELVAYNSTWEYITNPTATSPVGPGADYSGGFSGSTGTAPFGDATHQYDDSALGFPSAVNTYVDIATTIWVKKTIYVSSGSYKIRLKSDNTFKVFIAGFDVTSSFVALSSWVYEATFLNYGPFELIVATWDTQPTMFGGNRKYQSIIVTDLNTSHSIMDMNPAHIIRECLTDKFWGMGYQDADIDDTAFIAAANTLYTEGMGISILWDRQTRIEDFIQEIIKHIYATLYVDRITGKFVLKLIRNDYVFASLSQLDETNISKIESYSRPSFGELVNSVTVNYHDTYSNKTASVTVQDTALVQMQGSVIGATVQYPGFSNYTIAAKAAQRDLVSLSTSLLTCSLVTDRSVSNLNVGSVIKLYWPDFSDQVVAMRITGMAFGDGRSNKIKITCMEDIFTTPTTVITTPPDSEWTDPSVAPIPCPIELVMEAPYIEVVQTSGQTVADAALASNPDLGYMLVAASRPPSCINAEIFENSSGSYLQSFYLDFAPSGKLTAPISQTATSITLKEYSDLDQLVIGQAAKLNNEIVKVEAISGNVITIGRGLFDTTPAAHAIDSKFICYDSFNGSDNVEYSASESFNIKFLPVSGAGQLPITDAPVNTLTFNRRAIRPYLPGQIKISGSYFPASLVDVAISMTWAHRNRVQQTGADYLTFLSASVTPEVGTKYSIRLYNNTTSALIYSVDDLTGTTHSGFPVMTGALTLRIELWTVRDTYTSFQTFSHIFSYTTITRLTTEVGATERLLTEAGDTITTE